MSVKQIQKPSSSVILESGTSLLSEAKKKLSAPSLFNVSSFSTVKSVAMPDGSSIAVPSLSGEQIQQAQKLFGDIDDDKLKALQASGLQMTVALRQHLLADPEPGKADAGGAISSTSSGLTASQGPNTTGLTSSVANPELAQSVTNAAQTYQSVTGNQNYDDTTQAVMFMGVQGLQDDLTKYAQYVQGNLNDKKKLDAQAQDLNTELADWPDDGSTKNFEITTYDDNGKATTGTKTMTKAQAKAALDDTQSVISTFSEQNQVDQLALQNMSQRYSQGVSTISNILKMNFDTVKGIIGNIRA